MVMRLEATLVKENGLHAKATAGVFRLSTRNAGYSQVC